MVAQTRTGRRLWSWLVLAAVLVMAGCGDDNGNARPARTTTTKAAAPSTSASTGPTTSTTSDTSAVEAEVRAAYDAASRAFIEAAAIPDPGHSGLAATHAGPMLEQRREVLLGLKADGRAIRYPAASLYRVEVESVHIDGDTAVLEICGVDDGQRVIAETGEPVSTGVVTVKARAAMQRVDGTWRLAERTKEAEWQGVAGCAAD